MKILVTGAGGFVGSHVVDRARGRGLDVAAAAGDLRDAEIAERAVGGERPDAVVHLAARKRADDPWELLADELRMAGNMLRAIARHAPDAALLMPGSAGQYGMAGPDRLPETSPTAPVSAYGAIKCSLETACTASALRGGTRVIFTRSFNHVGPGQGLDAPVPSWALQVVEAERAGGGVLRTGRLDRVRDFLDVRDVADAYLDLVANPQAAGVVNVGSGVGVTLRDVVDSLVACAEVPVRVEPDPGLERAVDPPAVVADVTRLHALTGGNGPRIALGDSLADVLAEWRARLHAGAVS